jgi:hypothetical protein
VSFSPSLSITTFAAPFPSGHLTFTLTVTGTSGLTDTAITGVTVGNIAPVASAGPDQNVCSGGRAALNGSDSSDANCDDLTYWWTQTLGQEVIFTQDISLTTFYAPDTPGELTFSLTVTDTHGLADSTPDHTVVTVGTQLHAADLDCDCDVDIADVMAVASRWRCTGGEDCYETLPDLNGDGVIDVVDIMITASHWGWNCEDD